MAFTYASSLEQVVYSTFRHFCNRVAKTVRRDAGDLLPLFLTSRRRTSCRTHVSLAVCSESPLLKHYLRLSPSCHSYRSDRIRANVPFCVCMTVQLTHTPATSAARDWLEGRRIKRICIIILQTQKRGP